MVEQSLNTLQEEKQSAFMKAYNPCHQAFTRYCSALAYGKMNKDDLIQDILLSAYERFDKIKHKDRLLHYLIRAARYRSISNWRKTKYSTALLEKHGEELKAQGVSPEMVLDIQWMYRVLDQLPEKQKEAIILYEINGFSMKEIAKIQEDSVAAVKVRISRGRKKLRNKAQGTPKMHWFWALFGMKWNLEPVANQAKEELLFRQLRQLGSELNPNQIASLIQKGSSGINLPAAWLSQVSLNSVLLSGISVAIITANTFYLRPQETTQASQEIVKAQILPYESIMRDLKSEVLPKDEREFPKEDISPERASKEKPLQMSLIIDPIASENLRDEKPSLEFEPVAFSESIKGCPEQYKTQIDLKRFRAFLLKKLRQDNFLKSDKEEISIGFDKQDRLLIDGKSIDAPLEKKYKEFLADRNINPCPYRVVIVTPKYIAVGDYTDTGFHGGVHGKIDLDALNKRVERIFRGSSSSLHHYKGSKKNARRDVKNKKSTLTQATDILNAQKEKRKIGTFHSLKVSGVAVVYLFNGNSEYAELEVKGMPVEDVITKVDKGVLSITTLGEPQGEEIKILLQVPDIKSIEVDGAGEIYTSETLKANQLKIISKGVGAAWLDVDTQEVNIQMQGGDLNISGRTSKKILSTPKNVGVGTLTDDKLKVEK